MANNPIVTVIGRALFTMIVCYVIGRIIGGVAQHIVEQHIEEHKQQRPIPSPTAEGQDRPDQADLEPRANPPVASA
ncbi:MAG: hypothetical protein AAGG38_12950 [Planctomycetota bacterium]